MVRVRMHTHTFAHAHILYIQPQPRVRGFARAPNLAGDIGENEAHLAREADELNARARTNDRLIHAVGGPCACARTSPALSNKAQPRHTAATDMHARAARARAALQGRARKPTRRCGDDQHTRRQQQATTRKHGAVRAQAAANNTPQRATQQVLRRQWRGQVRLRACGERERKQRPKRTHTPRHSEGARLL